MIIPRRETAEAITWQLDGLLSGSHLLPPGLTAALRAYRDGLMRQCASQPWARTGHRARYGQFADAIARHIADGIWKPGDRLPSTPRLAETYNEKEKTMRPALFVLTVRGRLAREGHTYYVLPTMQSPADDKTRTVKTRAAAPPDARSRPNAKAWAATRVGGKMRSLNPGPPAMASGLPGPSAGGSAVLHRNDRVRRYRVRAGRDPVGREPGLAPGSGADREAGGAGPPVG